MKNIDKKMTKQEIQSMKSSEEEPIIATVNTGSGGLNLRAGPSPQFRRLTILAKDAEMVILRRTTGNKWLLVNTGTQLGWVMTKFVATPHKLTNIPIITDAELEQYTFLSPNEENYSPIPTTENYKAPNGLEIAPIAQVLGRLSTASPANIQDIAASQTALLVNFYNLGLEQARKSFNWALIAAIVGFLFFITAIFFLVAQGSQNASLVSMISGSLIEIISGINFYLYGKSTVQLAAFQSYLDRTQSILLANSICESLSDKHKDVTRSELVKIVAQRDNFNKI